jgi:parallel beta-helix repeat protein
MRTTACVASCILVLGISASNVVARTWYIKADGTGDAPTIQAGVDSAAVGDTVLVGAGTYTDTHTITVDGVTRVVNVHLYKDIRLAGDDLADRPVIAGPASNIAVYIDHRGSACELVGFIISTQSEAFFCVDAHQLWNDKVQPDFQTGIQCDSSPISITNNEISNNGYGIRLVNSAASVKDNSITQGYYGVACEDTSDAIIQGNMISDCAILIECLRSAPQISENTLSRGCSAISCGINSPAVITRNTIQNIDVWGVAILNSAAVVQENSFLVGDVGLTAQGDCNGMLISGNLYYRHVTSGIDLVGVSGATIENNTIDYAMLWSISFQESSPTVRNNILTRAPVGMRCLLGSAPSFGCNDIFDVTFPYSSECTDGTGINGNLAVDPEFCGIDDSGNYYLQSDSPCAPGNHPAGYDCGVIGALPVNCGTVPTKQRTWGSVKEMYKK